MTAAHVVTRRLVPALAIVLAVLAFTGCPGVFTISPGGTFIVDYYAGGDVSQMQVVVVFDRDDTLTNGPDYVYTFPVSEYEYPPGEVRVTRSFECSGVPTGDYFVYAFLDYDGDAFYSPSNPDYEVSWTYGDPDYYIDSSGVPFMIAAPYPYPDPNYTVSSTYAAPLEFTLSYGILP